MLIIIEGCDGAGKSSLVQALHAAIAAEELGPCAIKHFGPPTSWAVSEYELPLHDYAAGSGSHLICDRYHLGEYVYGPIYRGRSELEGAGGAHVRAALARRGAFIVYLLPPRAQLQAAVAERGDGYIDQRDINEIATRYARLSEAETLPHMVFRRYWLQSDVATILFRAARAEAAVRHVAEFSSLVGEPYPDVLFVGERRSSRAGDHIEAFVPWPDSPSSLLMEAIALLGWTSWAAINALEDDVALAVDRLRPRAVIALGEVAAKSCELAGIEHARIVHPGYARRWKQLTAVEYAIMIEEAR